MALPTTGLTLHCDASDTDKVRTTFDGSGVHTGVPVDGSACQVWDDEGDGIANVALIESGGTLPDWRSSVALMALPCLDFSGADQLLTCTQTGGAKDASNFIANNAFTAALVFYPEAVADTSADVTVNERLFGYVQGQDYMGIALRDVAGAKKIRAWNYDGSFDVTADLAISVGHTWIAILTHSGGNLTLTLIDDAGVETSDVVASGNTASLAFQLQIGRGATGWFNGRVGEFAVYNAAVAGADLTDLKTYFKAKWMGIGGTPAAGARGLTTMGAG